MDWKWSGHFWISPILLSDCEAVYFFMAVQAASNNAWKSIRGIRFLDCPQIRSSGLVRLFLFLSFVAYCWKGAVLTQLSKSVCLVTPELISSGYAYYFFPNPMLKCFVRSVTHTFQAYRIRQKWGLYFSSFPLELFKASTFLDQRFFLRKLNPNQLGISFNTGVYAVVWI